MPLAKIKYDENQNHLESKVCHKHVKFINFKYYKIIHFLSNKVCVGSYDNNNNSHYNNS